MICSLLEEKWIYLLHFCGCVFVYKKKITIEDRKENEVSEMNNHIGRDNMIKSYSDKKSK